MRDWKQIADGLGVDLPAGTLENVIAPLDAMENSFRPLVKRIPLETEPAYVLLRLPEDEA